MARVVAMEVGEGVSVNVLVSEAIAEAEPGAEDVAARPVREQLLEALDAVAAFATSMAGRVEKLRKVAAPDELSIDLGVSVGTKAGVVFTSVSADAQLKVSMTWK